MAIFTVYSFIYLFIYLFIFSLHPNTSEVYKMNGQFHMRGDKIQIFKKKLLM